MPVEDGVPLVPVIITVLLENAVVPFVPSNAASLTKILSTFDEVNAALVIITLPAPEPTCFNAVVNNIDVTAAVPDVNEIILPLVVDEPKVIVEDKSIEVNAAMLLTINLPVVLASADKDTDVATAIKLKFMSPPTDVNAGNEIPVNAGIVFILMKLDIVVNAAHDNVVKLLIEFGLN